MIEQKRRHTQTGGIADAKATAQIGIKLYGLLGVAQPRQMLDQIQNKSAGQIDRQHLDLKRRGKFGSFGDLFAVSRTQLTRSIDRCGAHQIANVSNLFRIRLLAFGKAVHHVIKQPYRAVGTRDRQLGLGHATGLLLGDILRQTGDVIGRRNAVKQRKRHIPFSGNHPVRTFLRWKIIGK